MHTMEQTIMPQLVKLTMPKDYGETKVLTLNFSLTLHELRDAFYTTLDGMEESGYGRDTKIMWQQMPEKYRVAVTIMSPEMTVFVHMFKFVAFTDAVLKKYPGRHRKLHRMINSVEFPKYIQDVTEYMLGSKPPMTSHT